MKKFIYCVLALVLAFSLVGFAAPAPSFIVSEAVAAPAGSTVTTPDNAFHFSQGALDGSVVIMEWTETNTTEGTLTGLTAILIKEGVTPLICDDIDLEWTYGEPPTGWSGDYIDCTTENVALGYQVEYVVGAPGGSELIPGDTVTWIRATADRDLDAFDGEVIVFQDQEGGTTRHYDEGIDTVVAGVVASSEVMYTAELLTTSVKFYESIGDAVDDANPGDTVIVHPGKYDETTIVINKTLTVESASGNWSDTIIDPPTVVFNIGPNFTGHATISGFTITGADYGIYIAGLAHGGTVTVTNCFIYNNGTGIYGEGDLDGGIFIDDCIITENGGKSDGINLKYVYGTVVVSNSVIGAYWDSVAGSYVGNSGDGIYIDQIYYMGNVTIGPNNIIAQNYGDGIKVDYVDGSLNITGNNIGAWDFGMEPDGRVSGNGAEGIDIESTRPGSSVVIQENQISENGCGFGGDAIEFGTIDGSVSILGNIIGAWIYYEGESSAFFGGNCQDGIEIDDVDGTLVINGNKIAENGTGGSDGIHINSIETDYEYNPSLGYHVYLAGSVTISNNYVGEWTDADEYTFLGNESIGISVGNDGNIEAGCTLAIGPDNTIVDNGFMGIYVDDADDDADVTIFDNTILRNGTAYVGIWLNDSEDVIVDGNEVSEHEYGIYLNNCYCNSVINNIITENESGIFIDGDSVGNGIVGNWICDNTMDGILVLGDHNDILRNVISGNTGAVGMHYCGVFLSSNAEDNAIYYNNITENTADDSYGVFNDSEDVVDARWNWWGDATGPYHGGTNPGSSGDAVSSYVNYSEPAAEAYDYTIDASMPWDTEGPVIDAAVVVPDVRSLYSALEDMWSSSWTADSPFSTGPSEGRYYVATSDVGAGAEPRGVKYVDIDIRAFVEQLLGGTSLEDIEGIPDWFICMVERHGQLRACDDDSCCGHTVWTTDGPLPMTVSMLIWWMGEDLFFSMVRPGEILVPVTVYDWCGNPTETFIETAVVDEALALGRGWNLRSTPINLAKNSWADITGLGGGLDYLIACRWNADTETWEQLTDDGLYVDGVKVGDAIVRPLDGIAIKCAGFDSLGLVYDREGQPGAPSKQLYEGWNLIGLAVSPPQDPFMPVDDALISVEEIRDDTRGYIIVDSRQQYVEEEEYYGFECCEDFCYDWYFGQEGWNFLRHGAEAEPPIPNMAIGGGYWVFMERDDILAGFSSTPFLSLTIEQGEDIPCIPRYPATTMTYYRDWLTVMRCPVWNWWIPDGWQGLQWAKVEYKGEFNLGDVFSFYEAELPQCGWQFSHKLVFSTYGPEQEARMVFWKEAEFAGVPYYTDIAHFIIYTNKHGPDFIEVVYLPVDVPTCPGTNLIAWESFPDAFEGDLYMRFEGAINSVEQLVSTIDFDIDLGGGFSGSFYGGGGGGGGGEGSGGFFYGEGEGGGGGGGGGGGEFSGGGGIDIDLDTWWDTYIVESGMEIAMKFYLQAMSKLGWEFSYGNAWGPEDNYCCCNLHFTKPSVGGLGTPPPPRLYCDINIQWCPEFDIVWVDINRGVD